MILYNFFYNVDYKTYLINSARSIAIVKYPLYIFCELNLLLDLKLIFRNIVEPDNLFIHRLVFSFFFLTATKPKIELPKSYLLNRTLYYKFIFSSSLNNSNISYFYSMYLSYLYNYFKVNNLFTFFIVSKFRNLISLKFLNYKALSELKPYRAFFNLNVPLYISVTYPKNISTSSKSFLSIFKILLE